MLRVTARARATLGAARGVAGMPQARFIVGYNRAGPGGHDPSAR